MNTIHTQSEVSPTPEGRHRKGVSLARVRTCALTRKQASEVELLRFAVLPMEPWLVPDPARKLGGRGIWLSHGRDMLVQASEKNIMRGHLKRHAPDVMWSEDLFDIESIRAQLVTYYKRRLSSLLQSCFQRRLMIMGQDAVREYIVAQLASYKAEVAKHEAARVAENDGMDEHEEAKNAGTSKKRLLLIAAIDLTSRAEEIVDLAQNAGVKALRVFEQKELGEALGRQKVAMVATSDTTMALALLQAAKLFVEYSEDRV